MIKSKQEKLDTARAVKKAEKEKFWKAVDGFLVSQCKGTEIAAYLDITAECLYERCLADKKTLWSIYSQKKQEKGRSILRHAQFEKAIKGKNTQMLIFLGKNILQQTDRQIIQTEEIQPQRAILKLPDNGRRFTPEELEQKEKEEQIE